MNCLRKSLLSILILLMTAALPACAASWVPVDGPYSAEAEQALFRWVQQQVAQGTIVPPPGSRDVKLLRNLIRGTLVWAYSYGSSFNTDAFLHHFTNRDDVLGVLKLQNGGLLFVLDSCNFKISRDKSCPENRITQNGEGPDHPRERWYASAFNSEVEISFYFSAVGPYSKLTP